jgi:hypothetical protein
VFVNRATLSLSIHRHRSTTIKCHQLSIEHSGWIRDLLFLLHHRHFISIDTCAPLRKNTNDSPESRTRHTLGQKKRQKIYEKRLIIIKWTSRPDRWGEMGDERNYIPAVVSYHRLDIFSHDPFPP